MTMNRVETKTTSRLMAHSSLADNVYLELLDRYMHPDFPPDAVISIDKLAKEFQTSQTPVREALTRLEPLGLVRRTALRGYRVAPLLSIDELTQLVDAILLIEPDNMFRAATKMNKNERALLESKLAGLTHHDPRISLDRYVSYLREIRDINEFLNTASGNIYLASSVQILNSRIERFRLTTSQTLNTVESEVGEISTLVAFLVDGDANGAREASRSYLKNLKGRLVRQLMTMLRA